jgi:hypothetical protein
LGAPETDLTGGGVGDYTAEKYDRPPQSFEGVTARIKKAGEEIRVRQGVS